MSVRIIQGDCRDVLKTLPSESVHCVVTSPPYWGLRDYGVAGQIGLEPTPEMFVTEMVNIFRLVRRALRPDGTCWINLGDSYMGGGRGGGAENCKQRTNVGSLDAAVNQRVAGYKQKDLVGVPWLVAFALRADGWWLRQDIIWSKPNPMPESVTDRCTKAHEYLFLLSKSERYYFDADAIAEDRAPAGGSWVNGWASGDTPHTALAHSRDKGDARTFRGGGKYTGGQERSAEPVKRQSHGNGPALAEKRNKRSVWEVATAPFPESHFATFPPALIEPCILAGCPKGGTVLDPFGGAGTTGLVANNHQRDAILIELNPEYVAMADRRIHGPLFAARPNVDRKVPVLSPESIPSKAS